MKAELVFHEKRLTTHRVSRRIAVAELKIWKVPRSEHYPDGRKFSLFLVAEGNVVVGVDNHKPKGPHRHLGPKEVPYGYVGDHQLLSDFWNWVRKEGFEL